MNRQQLKYEHRDRLVQIGIQAIEHALRFQPSEQATKIIEQRLAALRENDLQIIKSVIHERISQTYTKDNVLLAATVELCKLAVTEKYVSGQMLNCVLVKCWDAGIFLAGADVSNREMHAEMDWQQANLVLLIQRSFEQLWEQEDLLKQQKGRNVRPITVESVQKAGSAQ
jgi:hypothetical protein